MKLIYLGPLYPTRREAAEEAERWVRNHGYTVHDIEGLYERNPVYPKEWSEGDLLPDDADDAIRRMLEEQAEFLANVHAAEAWSTPSNGLMDDLGIESEEDVWILADFGGEIAVNGEWIKGRVPRSPPGFVHTRFGGQIPVIEEEVSVEAVIHGVHQALRDSRENVPLERIKRIVQDLYGDEELIYISVSGDSEVWARVPMEQDM